MDTALDQCRIKGLPLMNSPPGYTSPGKQHSTHTIFSQESKPHTSVPGSKRQYQHISLQTARQQTPTYASLNAEDAPSSPIHLRINASVRVCNSDNLVCFDKSPADHANAIAKAVVQAIEEHSSGQCGIPMIDEDGRPRPISIDVDAGVTIEGKGNIVGGRSTVCNALARRHGLARWGLDGDDEEDGEPSAKRRRPSAV